MVPGRGGLPGTGTMPGPGVPPAPGRKPRKPGAGRVTVLTLAPGGGVNVKFDAAGRPKDRAV